MIWDPLWEVQKLILNISSHFETPFVYRISYKLDENGSLQAIETERLLPEISTKEGAGIWYPFWSFQKSVSYLLTNEKIDLYIRIFTSAAGSW